MLTFFSCSLNGIVTSQKGVELICGGIIITPKIILFFMFVALKWLKTSIETLK